MTPTEIRNALAEIRNEGSPRAYVSVSISLTDSDRASDVIARFYPDDVVSRHHISGCADTFEGAIADLWAEWNKAKGLADKNSIRKMAIAIIEITTDQGECSDAALRGAGFYQPQITRLGSLACEEATRLAAGGPFQIIQTVGANAGAAA